MNDISPFTWAALIIALCAIAYGIYTIARARIDEAARKFNAEMAIISARRDEERRRYSGKNDRRKRTADFWHIPRHLRHARATDNDDNKFCRFYRDDAGELRRESFHGEATDEQVARCHSPAYSHPSCIPLPRSRHLADETQ